MVLSATSGPARGCPPGRHLGRARPVDDQRLGTSIRGMLSGMRRRTEWSPRCGHPRDLVKPVPLDPTGLAGPTRGQARGRRWRQSSRGVFVPTTVDGAVPEQRILEASVLLPDEDGAVTGWAGCRWRGAAYFDGTAADGRTAHPVALAFGAEHNPRPRPGIRILRDRLDPEDVGILHGVRCATVERSLFDEMRGPIDLREAVVAMDMAAAAELTSIARMRRFCTARTGWNGVPQVRSALDLASEDSMSPNETRMRLVWVLDAGLPVPLCNQPVFGRRGDLIGVADLLDPVAGVVGEYDGAAHRGAHRHRRDVMREERFRRAGLEYFKVVGLDLLDPGLVVDRMRSTRARARALPPGRQNWTMTPPEGWYDSPLEAMPLDERLAHREWLHGEVAGERHL